MNIMATYTTEFETEEVLVPTTITKADLQALKSADSSICFYLMRSTCNTWGTGSGEIRCHAKVKPPKGFNADTYMTDACHTITCAAHLHCYSANWLNRPASVSASVSAYAYCPVYKTEDNSAIGTLIDFLRVGDTITLAFKADCYEAGYARNKDGATLHYDQLCVKVSRGKGKTYKGYSFLINTSLCANNTARMVQGL